MSQTKDNLQNFKKGIKYWAAKYDRYHFKQNDAFESCFVIWGLEFY